ncbi:hypothetical protein Taro_055617 [Colocasia esculenta]|uniref:Uncharacterized protein n=1 Tax=Colocasia esculenta TaxID=4460 RepID=A0A843XTU6_COLES|nr:hypothetical protein [Colocasia esculenta]
MPITSLVLALAFTAAPLTLCVPPVRKLTPFAEALEVLLRRTAVHVDRLYPYIRDAFSASMDVLIQLCRHVYIGLIYLSALLPAGVDQEDITFVRLPPYTYSRVLVLGILASLVELAEFLCATWRSGCSGLISFPFFGSRASFR